MQFPIYYFIRTFGPRWMFHFHVYSPGFPVNASIGIMIATWFPFIFGFVSLRCLRVVVCMMIDFHVSPLILSCIA